METVSVDIQPNKKEDEFEQLFPRLPNEITFCRIVPILPWRAFHILATVSRSWRKAIQSHRVYDARFHSRLTDTLVVHCHPYSRGFVKIPVHSMRDKLCYDLPPIPWHCRGIPWSCECVSLDGKIYVLGGAADVCVSAGSMDKPHSSDSSSKVYVLDLAGASHWKEFASMERGRQEFGCGVIDGKIYVFGGTHDYRPVRGAEMYNPEVNAWSPIMPMTFLRAAHQTCTLAGNIVVHGGEYYSEDYTGWRATEEQYCVADPRSTSFKRNASFWEIYDPGTDKWTVYKPFSEDYDYSRGSETMFTVEGKFHVMHEGCIYVHDDRSWKLLKVNSFPRLAPIAGVEDHGAIVDLNGAGVTPYATVVVNDELVAGVSWDVYWGVGYYQFTHCGSSLLQSEGFGTENNRVVWKVVSKCSGAFEFMHCIQL